MILDATYHVIRSNPAAVLLFDMHRRKPSLREFVFSFAEHQILTVEAHSARENIGTVRAFGLRLRARDGALNPYRLYFRGWVSRHDGIHFTLIAVPGTKDLQELPSV